jgi:hypothetical protein
MHNFILKVIAVPMKQNKLLQQVIRSIGKRGRCSLDALYTDICPRFGVNKDVLERAILELDEQGIAFLAGNDEVSLTTYGISSYELLCERLKSRRARKLEQKCKESREVQIRRKKLQTLEVHERIKEMVGRLAYLLGKVYKVEYVLCEAVRVDIVWYDSSTSLFPSHAFEVQNHGESKNAIHNLEACRRRFPSCKVYLIVREEKEIGQIESLLANERNTIVVLRVAKMEQWLGCLEQIGETNRLRLMKHFNEKSVFNTIPISIRQGISKTIDELRDLGIYHESAVMIHTNKISSEY